MVNIIESAKKVYKPLGEDLMPGYSKWYVEGMVKLTQNFTLIILASLMHNVLDPLPPTPHIPLQYSLKTASTNLHILHDY